MKISDIFKLVMVILALVCSVLLTINGFRGQLDFIESGLGWFIASTFYLGWLLNIIEKKHE